MSQLVPMVQKRLYASQSSDSSLAMAERIVRIHSAQLSVPSKSDEMTI